MSSGLTNAGGFIPGGALRTCAGAIGTAGAGDNAANFAVRVCGADATAGDADPSGGGVDSEM